MVTGIGRFCNSCKKQSSPDYSWRTGEQDSSSGLLKNTDLNKLKTFVTSPKKYATGTERAKAKIEYLDNLVDEMDDRQRNQYQGAKQIYETALKQTVTPRASVSTARAVELINVAIENHHTLTITYKGFKRDIYPYKTDGKYCIAYCTLRKELRTFRIDRMEDVRVTGIFNPDENLVADAESKIGTASTFRNYRSYKRY